MTDPPSPERHLGLLGATGVGVGAIVGGGILALAGVAFATTGPSAIVAFGLNGCIAFLTVFSFAELAARFPQSGGTYTYARKVLTVEVAFAVGWVVWFASVVAAVLYAMGFAVFLVPFLERIAQLVNGEVPGWIGTRPALIVYALAAVGYYKWRLTRAASGVSQWETVGKVVVFAVVVVAGFFALATEPPPPGALGASFRPFFAEGFAGLAQAMGYTFIALQGFDLIAAVGGEVRDAERNLPRSMFLSLGTALAIYLPLLFLIVAVGTPDRPIVEAAAANPEILVADAVRNFMGPAGYWLIVAAGLLSMLSALQANLLAASRFARTMGADRTLPPRLAHHAPGTGAPTAAIRLSAIVVALLIVAVPDVAAAGAMASLIFLACFALTHKIGYLARRRTGKPSGFRAPAFPLVPLVGGSACLVIGLYQAVAVPPAGVLAAVWLGVGAVLYSLYLAPRARAVDASTEARDPEVMKLRGRRPVVLVPIANPASAETLVTMGRALAPPEVSRVQLLSVVAPPGRYPDDGLPQGVRDAQAVLGGALGTALRVDLRPEALITLHGDPWGEIARVAEATRCESLLLGVGELDDSLMTGPLAGLIAAVDADVVILRAPNDWTPDNARRILVPSRGGRDQSPVRARLLGSLSRTAARDVAFLGVLSEKAGPGVHKRAFRDLERLARDEVGTDAHAELAIGDDVVAEVAKRAQDTDLLILGFHRSGRRRAVFSTLMLKIARATECPLLMISHRRGAALLPESSILGRAGR
ncbi:MAG: amino acid permease [Gemmatimonadetes bacterium]|nr:amino acid permease [Gemmatimonadota bacterium]MYG22161.1 amino acid permease [Gemmatimonadota bacterium]MYJ39536.1 amino acid permease [Gemmatimonadota bacterium]